VGVHRWGSRVPPKTRHRQKDDAYMRAFGDRVRALRLQQGLTQEKLAELAGISAAEVGFIERAEREAGLIMITRLADGLTLPLSELFSALS